MRRGVRRHPILFILVVPAGAALGLVAGNNHWSDLALYGAMTGVIAVFGVLMLLADLRQRGPELFREHPRASPRRSPRP